MRIRSAWVAMHVALGIVAAGCASAERGSAPSVPVVPPIRAVESGSLAALAGRQWVLREWRAGEPFVGKPVVTLTYGEGRFAGRAGCNRYSADAKPGAAAGEVTVGPIGATRMMCLPPVMALESRYLDALRQARRWVLLPSGDLAVTYAAPGGDATLVFSEVTAVRSD